MSQRYYNYRQLFIPPTPPNPPNGHALSSSGFPPEEPPRKPDISSGSLFDGFPPITRREREKVLEQTIVHLLWDILEKFGFEIYPEQYISKNMRIDLIAVKDTRSIGIEVKCKAELENRDIKQILSYKEILESIGIPLVAFWVPTSFPIPISDYEVEEIIERGHNFEVINVSIGEKIEQVIDTLLIGFIREDPSMYITIDNIILHADTRTYTYLPISKYFLCKFVPGELKGYLLERLDDSTENSKSNINLQKKRELEVEHRLWNFLRDHKYKVLCQYPIRLDKNHKRRIDLIGVANHYDPVIPHKKVGIEVKQKLTKKGIVQATEYNYQLMHEGIRTYIGIPPQGIPKKFQTFKQRIKEIEANQLGLALIDPHTTIVEFYEPPFSESEIKDIFNNRHVEKETKGTRKINRIRN